MTRAAQGAGPPVVVGLGELLWDLFPDGPRFGGAPTNFACSAAELARAAAHVQLVSAVGADDLGTRALQELASHHVDPSAVVRLQNPTGNVSVSVDEAGHASYVFAEGTAWDHIPWTPTLAALAARTSAVCFGSLGQRCEPSRGTIRQFVAATPATALRILDINLRPPHWTAEVLVDSLQRANVFKCNEDELEVLSGLLDLSGTEFERLDTLRRQHAWRMVALTRGGAGSLLLDGTGEVSESPSPAVEVVDTVGAGDAFTAALTLGMLRQLPLRELHHWASRVAAYVCSCRGATVHFPAELSL